MVSKIDNSHHYIPASPELGAQSSHTNFLHLENSTSKLATSKEGWEAMILKVSKWVNGKEVLLLLLLAPQTQISAVASVHIPYTGEQ